MQKQLPSRYFVSRREAAAETTDLIDSESPSRRDPIRWLVGCGIVLIAAIAIGTAIMISNFRERALESTKRELENTVLLLARHYDQQLDDVEVPLNDLITQTHLAGIASPGDFKRQMSTPEMHLLLKAKVSEPYDIAGINVYDAGGTLINSSEVSIIPAVNIADRAYFKALKSSRELMAHEGSSPRVTLFRLRSNLYPVPLQGYQRFSQVCPARRYQSACLARRLHWAFLALAS
jgi:hypothetical protein